MLSAGNYSKTAGDKKEQPPEGPHMARVVGLTDLGHQPEWEYQGKTQKSQYKMELTYELVGADMEDGRPFHVSEDINVNDFEPKPGQEGKPSTMMLRVRAIDLNNETSDGKDLSKLLDKPAMVTVKLNEKGYVKIKQESVSSVPMGFEVPPLRNDAYAFDLSAPDPTLFESMSEFKQGKILRALNCPDSLKIPF
jgi:hypothetical protein